MRTRSTTQWTVADEPLAWAALHATGGTRRIIYAPEPNGRRSYRVAGTDTRVRPDVVSLLIQRGYITHAENAPAGTYVVTSGGVDAWASANLLVYGVCAWCEGPAQALTSALVDGPDGGRVFVYLCETCKKGVRHAHRP